MRVNQSVVLRSEARFSESGFDESTHDPDHKRERFRYIEAMRFSNQDRRKESSGPCEKARRGWKELNRN
jgi:hypothetical protein